MVDLLEIVRRVTGFIDEFEFLFGVICFVLGVIFAIKGLLGAAKRQEMGPGQGSWGGPMMMFMTGALFVAIPGLVNSLSQTIFASRSRRRRTASSPTRPRRSGSWTGRRRAP